MLSEPGLPQSPPPRPPPDPPHRRARRRPLPLHPRLPTRPLPLYHPCPFRRRHHTSRGSMHPFPSSRTGRTLPISLSPLSLIGSLARSLPGSFPLSLEREPLSLSLSSGAGLPTPLLPLSSLHSPRSLILCPRGELLSYSLSLLFPSLSLLSGFLSFSLLCLSSLPLPSPSLLLLSLFPLSSLSHSLLEQRAHVAREAGGDAQKKQSK